ncbi:MAG: tetratricopeptide repeat protein [Planctomycetales bacterium]|nr:tetratricopeptide repeat protein [Planctomycetales bacterium]
MRYSHFALLALLTLTTAVRAEGPGQEDLDEALRVKITAEDLRDWNRTIDLLQSALDKGLDVESSDFAEELLAETLMQRVSQLTAAYDSQPPERRVDPRMQQVRGMAVSDLRRILAYDEPPSVAKLMLAKLLTGPGGDPHESRRLLTEFLEDEEAPVDQRAVAYAIRAGLQTQPDKQAADIDAAIELEPENPKYLLARAAMRRQRSELDGALTDVAAVLAASPEDMGAYLLQSEILTQQGKPEEALGVLAKASEMMPDSPIPAQQRGEIYRSMGDFEHAVEEFTIVLDKEPNSLLTRIFRAESYLGLDETDRAMADVDAVLEKQPGLVAALRLHAQVLAAEDKIDEAIAEMDKLIAAAPNQPELQMQLALYCVIAKQPRRAIDAYNAVLADEPDNYLARRNRGDAFLTIGDHATAVSDFDKALELQPLDPSLLNNLAWVLATSPDDEVRDGDRAVDLAKQAAELTEYKAAHILSTLAAAYAEAGDFVKAREWSEQAVELSSAADDDQIDEQLAAELASYQAGKPWRERQTIEGDEPGGVELREDVGDDEEEPTNVPPITLPPTESAPGQSIDF